MNSYNSCLKCDICPRLEPPKLIKTIDGTFCGDCIIIMAKIGKLYLAHKEYFKTKHSALQEFLV